MKERDILRFEGPLGSFFLHESEKPIVLVASGTGFAPIKAIIESAFKRGVERPMTLYWGARRPKDLYLDELPRKWATEHPQQLKYVPVISEALPEDQWTGRTGFVHRAVMEDLPDLSGYQVYACGVPIMVDSARRDFTHERRLPIDEFFADSFTTQADLAAG
jgi:CDP-4-dehydro-6-deoxyglucose reductase